MPLGYILKKEEVLGYYGLERNDIAEALVKYGGDRKVTMTTDPGVLGRGGGKAGFTDAGEILELAHRALNGMDGDIPRKYPAFHGTLARSIPTAGLILRKMQRGADLVFDIDVKSNFRQAFKEGAKILKFLDFYNAPYRVKFSGGSGPHIIIPFEAFPDGIGRFDRAHKTLFQFVVSRSRANHVDGSFTSFGHFYRMPYSLNENTGLVSLPLTRDQYDDFTLSMAEAHNVKVNEEWFKEPDEDGKEAIADMLQEAAGKSRSSRRRQTRQASRTKELNVQQAGDRDLSDLNPEELQKVKEEHQDRLRRLVELKAPSKIINREKELLREAERALRERR